MKKLITIALATFGVLSLTGCNLLDKAIDGLESAVGLKMYTYQEFVDYWNENGSKHSYKSALETDSSVSPKVSNSYTLNTETHKWESIRYIDVDGTPLVLNVEKYFDAYYYVEMTLRPSYSEDDMDDKFIFFNNTKEEKWCIQYKKNDEENDNQTLEITFDNDGLMSTMVGKGDSKLLGTIEVNFKITYQK